MKTERKFYYDDEGKLEGQHVIMQEFDTELNGVVNGYAANILAALIGLVLLATGHKLGVGVCCLAGLAFGCAHMADGAMFGLPIRHRLYLACVAFDVAAYVTALLGV